jgi:plasmid maintenance system antidote protein VapI
VINGQHDATPEMAVRLKIALGGSSADFWLRMQMDHDLPPVRLHPEKINATPLNPKVS